MKKDEQLVLLSEYIAWAKEDKSVNEFVSQRENAEKAKRYDELVASHGTLLHYDPAVLGLSYGVMSTLEDTAGHQPLTLEDWEYVQRKVAELRSYHGAYPKDVR